MKRIVLAEPDPALRRILVHRLEREGFELRPFELVREALDVVDSDHVDAMVLTISPRDAGVVELREVSDLPFLALLPRNTAVMDALDVLDAGADDYVIKPFSPRELIARLNSLLRRVPANAVAPTFSFDGGLVIDTTMRTVTVRGESVTLPAKEFNLLAFLAGFPRQVFTRQQLMSQVWGTDADVTTATVTEHVRRLRQRIELDPKHPRWITTVWSVGYRFDP